MIKITRSTLALLFGMGTLTLVHAADRPPVGSLDVADGTHIAGWASDPDYSGPIMVHVYVDGQMTQRLMASSVRSDVGAHAFDWYHEPFGAGPHQVVVYALGVDASGVSNGVNVALPGVSGLFNIGCQGLVGSVTGGEYEWCVHYPRYWINRATNTKVISNETIRVGVDSSLGGTLTQLYAGDWTRNLIMQHGGSAVQLSFYAAEAKGPRALFYPNVNTGECDPTLYPTDAACRAAHPAFPLTSSCTLRGDSLGAHVANCTTVRPCGFPDAGAPFNPIQAVGPNCTWNHPINPIVSSDLTTWQATISNFNDYAKSTTFPGLSVDQKVVVGDAYAQVIYDITYNGPYQLTSGPTELPAFFTGAGMNDHAYYYSGPGYSDPNSPVTRVPIYGQPEFRFALPARPAPNPPPVKPPQHLRPPLNPPHP